MEFKIITYTIKENDTYFKIAQTLTKESAEYKEYAVRIISLRLLKQD